MGFGGNSFLSLVNNSVEAHTSRDQIDPGYSLMVFIFSLFSAMISNTPSTSGSKGDKIHTWKLAQCNFWFSCTCRVCI